MAYQAWSVVFGEQPTASKWNILGTNDASFHDGTGIDDDAILNRHILTGNLYASKMFTNYKFRARRTSTQTPSAATFTKMQMNVEDFDTGSNYDNATNYRFTAPVAGFYLFIARTSIGSGANGRLLQCLYKNGTIYSRGSDVSQGTNPNGGLVVDFIQLAQSDYIEYWVYSQNATATENSNDINMFSGHLVSTT